jgi:FKBP-type peptidyl-prolyl cis-trans isomerase FkpA
LIKLSVRVLGVLLASVFTLQYAVAQDAAPSSERDKVGYMLGLDAGRAVGPGYPELDLAAFQRAVESTLNGDAPLLSIEDARKTSQALMANIIARSSGKPGAALDREKAGLLMGTTTARTLINARGQFDMPMFMRGLKDGAVPPSKPLMDAAEVEQVRGALAARLATVQADQRKQQGETAQQEEQAFFAKNKLVKGVFTTPSGLQYSVLRQGNGVRPKPGQRVRVNYVGTLLNGKKFDSSYDRGEPAEFSLDQVIKGWTEGVGMMPIGAKYRFWVPAALGYGERGAGRDIPPNATLMFDVELLGVE